MRVKEKDPSSKINTENMLSEADLGGGGVGGARPPFQDMKPLSWEGFLILHAPIPNPMPPLPLY